MKQPRKAQRANYQKRPDVAARIKTYNVGYYAENKEVICARRKEYARTHVARKRKIYLVAYIRQRAKSRATKRGLPFDLEMCDIVVPERCPLLGILLVHNLGGNKPAPNSPSLDRIDSSKGYVKGNVRVISHKANTMKNNATAAELRTFAINILKETLVQD